MKLLQALIDGVRLFSDVPNAFGMRSVSMRVEAHVEKIQRTALSR